MINLFRKNNGAVTIFLVIILVPMITVTSLFVDAAKIKLSQAVVDSAGDLALNTVLSKFDSDLSEYYGLMASAQDIDSFMSTAEEYFKATLISAGASEEEAEFGEQVMSNILNKSSNKDIADFLGIEIDEAGVDISKVPNGSLTNPALIKTQIVEFMKYRAPINKAADIFTLLKDQHENLKNAEKDTDMTDKKNDFYETENDLLEKCLEAYKHLYDYKKNAKLTKDKVTEINQKIDDLENNYKELHDKVAFDLINTSGKSFSKMPIQLASPIYSKDSTATESNIKDIKKDIDTVLKKMSEYEGIGNLLNGTSEKSTHYLTQYWVQTEEKLNSSNITRYYENAHEIFVCISHIEEFVNDTTNGSGIKYNVECYKNITDGDKTIGEHWKNIEKFYKDNLMADFTKYDLLVSRLSEIYEQASSGTQTYKIATSGNVGKIGRTKTQERITELYNLITDYYDLLDAAAKTLKAAKKSLEDAKDLLEDYRTDFNAWKSAANNNNSDLGKSDQNEVNSEETQALLKTLKEEKIDSLVTRLSRTMDYLNNTKDYLYECKYNGKKIKNLDKISELISWSNIKANEVSMVRSEITSYANSKFKFTKGDRPALTNNNHPTLHQVNTPEFYTWLKTKFTEYTDNESEADSAKEDYEKIKDQKKEEEKKSENVGDEESSDTDDKSNEDKEKKEIVDMDPRPSNGSGSGDGGDDEVPETKIKEVSKTTTDLFSVLTDGIFDAVTTLRDDLYVTDYITSMFSYATYEDEGRYALLDDSTKKTVTPKNHEDKYATVNTEWTNESKIITYNKSLTNNMINATNNYAFGSEVEYILYGGKNSSNEAKAYASIFAIRYAMNLAPVFSLYWKGTHEEASIVEGIAVTINSLTQGIIPVALVKLVICLALVAVESVTDMSYIKAGIGIKFTCTDYSSPTALRKYLFCSFSSSGTTAEFGSDNSSEKKDIAADSEVGKLLYLQYSDYLTIFLALNLLNEDKANGIYLRTADAIQANIRQITGNNKYILSNSQVYFKIDANVKVSPLMLGLPINTNADGEIYDISEWSKYNYMAYRGY